MGGRASSRSIGLAGTSHSRALAVAFVVAARAWVGAGQTTIGAPYGTVRLTNDGLRLEAYLYRPVGAGPFPLVVHRHSGARSRDTLGCGHRSPHAGYAVLLPERRGTGSAEGQRFTEVGDDRDRIGRLRAAFNAAEAGDVLAAVEQVTRDTASGARMSWHSWRSTCPHTHDQHRRSVDLNASTNGRINCRNRPERPA